MRQYALLSVLQYAIFSALVVIGCTTFYALSQTGTAPGTTTATDGAAAGAAEVPENYRLGRRIWNDTGCGGCHAKSMTMDATGPALAGVTNRWAAEPREHLYGWIRNSVVFADSGTSDRAVDMVRWSDRDMPAYPHLTDADIEALLAFIEGGA